MSKKQKLTISEKVTDLEQNLTLSEDQFLTTNQGLKINDNNNRAYNYHSTLSYFNAPVTWLMVTCSSLNRSQTMPCSNIRSLGILSKYGRYFG